MKNTTKRILDPSLDIMAEARKHKNFSFHLQNERVKTLLAVEVYKMRRVKKFSQQQLAKKVRTTQKVISYIEDSYVNVGIELLNRLAQALDFTAENWSKIFQFPLGQKQYSLVLPTRTKVKAVH